MTLECEIILNRLIQACCSHNLVRCRASTLRLGAKAESCPVCSTLVRTGPEGFVIYSGWSWFQDRKLTSASDLQRFKVTMRAVQGAIIAASGLHIILGFSGLMGPFCRSVSVAPLLLLLLLSERALAQILCATIARVFSVAPASLLSIDFRSVILTYSPI